MLVIWNVYVCMNFRAEIILRGEECKTQVKLNFFEKGKKGKIVAIVQVVNLKIYRSRMAKRTSSLDSSRKI